MTIGPGPRFSASQTFDLSLAPCSKILVRRFDRRMAFVPEGQADSSQARSAWEAMESTTSRRDGRSRCQSRDICRRNEVNATLETLGIPVERYVGV